MNNAATGFPKFDRATKAMMASIQKGILSPNRDSVVSKEASAIVFGIRNEIGNLLHATKPHEVVLTASDTIALNMILLGMGLKAKDCLIVDSMSHNAISRPAKHLSLKYGVQIIYANNITDVENAISKYKKKIKGAVFSHASNVTGDVIDIQKIGDACFKNNIPFIIDAAQSIGLVDIDVEKAHASAVTFAGHKGLNGPQGTGGFYIRKGFKVNPILFGGNGSDSLSITPPLIFPDSFEVGTPAMHDLVGLYFSLIEIKNQIGIFTYRYKLRDLVSYAYKQISTIPNVVLYGESIKEIPVISFNIKGKKCKEVGEYLTNKYDIICRTGVHCAALAVKKLDCIDEFGGTVRISFGFFNTKEEIDILINGLKELVEEQEV